MGSSVLIQFRNCRLVRNHGLVVDDLWVRDGKIINPESVFFDERRQADVQIDCKNAIIAPGFIDLQINGNVRLGDDPDSKVILITNCVAFLVTRYPSSKKICIYERHVVSIINGLC